MDNQDLEEETDEEVAKVLNEVLAGRRKFSLVESKKNVLRCF